MNLSLLRLSYLSTLMISFTIAGCNANKDGGGNETGGSGNSETHSESAATGDETAAAMPDGPEGFVYSGHEPEWLDEQNWTRAESQDFYFQDQGSELVPFDWFMALELADSEESFTSDEHMIALGYINQPKSPSNKHGLPIGFVADEGDPALTDIKIAAYGPKYDKANFPRTTKWLGLTCAACHTADITYNGSIIRVDGGPSMADHEAFLAELAAALRATSDNDTKFKRFEQGIRDFRKRDSGGGDTDDLTTLRAELKSFTEHMEELVAMNKADQAYGFARLDAFGAILNEITVAALGIPENREVSDAPVSFPYLWYSPSLDYVQWNRSATNAIARNVGEVLGVYAHLQLTGTPATGQFRSTANYRGLDHLEKLLQKLKAPVWPEKILGAIDQQKADHGASLFAENCKSCHGVRDENGKFPMTEPNALGLRFIKTSFSPPSVSGTDPEMVNNVLRRKAKPGDLKPYLSPPELQTLDEVPAASVLKAAVGGVIGRYAKEKGLDQEQLANLAGGHIPPDPDGPDYIPVGYIARPLYGIWATAPFLHNGSVPNLYELLLPDADRSASFYVGSREFDPKRVGFVTTKSAVRAFKFETMNADGLPIPGNMNTGHSGPKKTQTKGDDGQWRDFTDDERWALVEYMKTLK